jgi:hypothetical protein
MLALVEDLGLMLGSVFTRVTLFFKLKVLLMINALIS